MSIEGGQDSDKGTHRKRKDWLLYIGGKGILKVMNGETSKVIKRKSEKEIKKTLEIYKKMNMFHHDHQLQVYMYDFMYVDPKTIPEEE